MSINDEYIFTYNDYLEITHLNWLYSVAEEGARYQFEEEQELNDETEGQSNKIKEKNFVEKGVHQKHDKSFKEALSNKEEMKFFLREFVGIEIDAKELQEYKSEFINKQYDKRQSDVVYKNTKKEVYYIVEHQSSRDIEMPFRIGRYCIDLMENVIKNSNSKLYPIIVPIVLYTGKGKWNIETNFAERQKIHEETYEKYKINIKYTVIDINEIKDGELLEKQDYLANIMLMEKCKTNEERAEMLKKIYNEMKDEKQKEKILNYTINMYKQTMKTKELKKLYEILERSGESMTAMYQYIIKEREENIKKGRASGILAIIKNMLKYNEDDEKIMKYTNAKKEDIDRVRKELNMKV